MGTESIPVQLIATAVNLTRQVSDFIFLLANLFLQLFVFFLDALVVLMKMLNDCILLRKRFS